MKLLKALAFAILCTACSCSGVENLASDSYSVDVVFPPSGLGDSGYNDMTLYGVRRACRGRDVRLTIHQPSSVEAGWQAYVDWLEESPVADKRIFIFAGNDYEALLRASAPQLEEGSTVVMFETDAPLENVSCFRLDAYGASWCLGKLIGRICDSAATLSANPHDANVARCREGFTDGFLDEMPDGECADYTISDTSGGYNNPDKAYEMAYDLYVHHSFVFPLAGGSNMGVMRYTREYPRRIFTAGVDVDMSIYSGCVVASVVKRMDRVVENLLARWLAGTAPAAYARYGLDSDYVDLVPAEDYKEFFEPFMHGLKEEAITKELENVEGD